jgi:hypothetical protein
MGMMHFDTPYFVPCLVSAQFRFEFAGLSHKVQRIQLEEFGSSDFGGYPGVLNLAARS